MSRRAVIIGINEYESASISPLSGAVHDAELMTDVLSKNEDGSPNFECRQFTSPAQKVTRALVKGECERLFADGADAALFYFAGHGCPTTVGGFLVTWDGKDKDWGISMQELLDHANSSRVKEVLFILDCCNSGNLGDPASVQGAIENRAILREGVTILAACRSTQNAVEIGGQGMFTAMVLHALHGGAADVMGLVSAASIYAHVDLALGAWDQRPIYKSYASRLGPIRKCEPAVPLGILRILPTIFVDPIGTLLLDPSYEVTNKTADPAKVAVFNNLKIYRNARLVRTTKDDDLYYAALNSTGVRLTGLGRFYWHLAKNGRI